MISREMYEEIEMARKTSTEALSESSYDEFEAEKYNNTVIRRTRYGLVYTEYHGKILCRSTAAKILKQPKRTKRHSVHLDELSSDVTAMGGSADGIDATVKILTKNKKSRL